jgi:hypothetical protein
MDSTEPGVKVAISATARTWHPLMEKFPCKSAATVAFRSAHAVPTLLNGSFEAPAIPPGTALFGDGGTFWFGRDVNIFANNHANIGLTPYGNQYLSMNPGPGGTDQQLVAGFLAGETYLLDVFFADLGGHFNPSSTLSITLTGAATGVSVFNNVLTFPVGGYGSNNIPFELAQMRFTAIADGSVNFLLSDIGGGNLAVDNVTLNRVPDTNSSALLLGLGLLGVVFVRRALGWQRVAA